MWTQIPQSDLSTDLLRNTQAEALGDGWLWGASLPGGQYRIMLVFDPAAAHGGKRGTPVERLRSACLGAELFAASSARIGACAVEMCSATPYLAPDSWQDGHMKIGDAAFALDPISSSGVEKAMRFALQAAIAVHTLLSNEAPAGATLARYFFEHRLIETCARHAHWTASSYGQVWCAERPFWHQRSSVHFGEPGESPWAALQARLYEASKAMAQFQAPELRPLAALDPRRALHLNPQASKVDLPCVVADRVQVHTALAHPHLERPLAFLENEALFPHLDRLRQPQLLDQVLRQFGAGMSAQKANWIVAWLWQRGVIDSVG